MTISRNIRFLFLGAIFTTTGVGCSYKGLDKSADTAAKAQKIEIKRTYRVVKTYNCEGRVIDQEWETAESPTYQVKIEPRSDVGIVTSEFTNRTTDSIPCTLGLYKFTIDMAPGWCNMRVEKGINEVEYRFYNIKGLVESGTLYLDIGYSEYFDPNVKEVRPDRYTCTPPTH